MAVIQKLTAERQRQELLFASYAKMASGQAGHKA